MLKWLAQVILAPLVRALVGAGLRILERQDMKAHGRVEVENALLRKRLEELVAVQAARDSVAARIERDGVRATDIDERQPF